MPAAASLLLGGRRHHGQLSHTEGAALLVPGARGTLLQCYSRSIPTFQFCESLQAGDMQVGLVACNDYIILESCIYRILKKHFGSQPYYAQLLDFFHEVCDHVSNLCVLGLGDYVWAGAMPS